MNKKEQREEKRRKQEIKIRKLKRVNPYIQLAIGMVTAILVLIEARNVFFDSGENSLWGIISLILAFLIVVANAWVLWVYITTNSSYEYLKLSDKFSMATLEALKETERLKKRYILQTTYGSVPKWHPINYIENVLVYDVHEQLRSILFELQKIIIRSDEKFSDHNVTVDFVYCYPTKPYKGELPYPPYTCGKFDNNTWRIITSGNHSSGGSMKSYLGRHDSFYCLVDRDSYVFFNDKSTIANTHYVPSNMDSEHQNAGSIIGIEIELRNDYPESVFVKGILTITTYGRKLYEDGAISEEEFKELFKDKIINSFSSLIKSELAQMYIRHAIRGEYMKRSTGKLKTFDKKSSEGEDSCRYCKKK